MCAYVCARVSVSVCLRVCVRVFVLRRLDSAKHGNPMDVKRRFLRWTESVIETVIELHDAYMFEFLVGYGRPFRKHGPMFASTCGCV